MSHLATLDTSLHSHLPASTMTMFEAKARKKLSFEKIAQELGRNEVAVAAIFYGQARASEEDIPKLSKLLGVGEPYLTQELAGFPDRGRTIDMPPKEPLIYRLFEIVQNYGYAYKAVLNEKFGDGIMSAIAFSTKVEKETDKDGNNWAVITLRGKCTTIMGQAQSGPDERRDSNSSTASSNAPLTRQGTKNTTTTFGTARTSTTGGNSIIAESLDFTDVPLPSPVITKPMTPTTLRRMSELNDVHDLMRHSTDTERLTINSAIAATGATSAPGAFSVSRQPRTPLVQSPSGNVLDAKQFLEHPDRPLTIGERQARIRAALERGETFDSLGSMQSWYDREQAGARMDKGKEAVKRGGGNMNEKGGYGAEEEEDEGCCYWAGCFGRGK